MNTAYNRSHDSQNDESIITELGTTTNEHRPEKQDPLAWKSIWDALVPSPIDGHPRMKK